MNQDPKAAPGQVPLRQLVWIAMLIAVAMYGVVGFLALREPVGPSPVPGWIWFAIGVVLGAGAFWLPRVMDEKAVARPTGPRVLRMNELLGWALGESLAIVGLVQVILGGPRSTLVGFLVASAVILILQKPRD